MAHVAVTTGQSGQTIRVRTGDEIELTLEENPTTGFRWAVVASGDPTLQMVDRRSEPMAGGGMGAGGRAVFRFTAASPGEAQLSLVMRREWQPEDAADRFRIDVVVEP